jgi:hypothetical protein
MATVTDSDLKVKRRFRKIDPRIWNDAKFRALSDQAKLLFFFILTHQHLTAMGAMRASTAGLAEELGWEMKAFREAFQELLAKGLVKFDKKASCLVVKNFLKYNPPENPNVVKGWRKADDLIPECELKTELIQNVKDFLKGFSEDFLKAFLEGFGGPLPKSGAGAGTGTGEKKGEASPPQAGSFAPSHPTFPVNTLVKLWNEIADPVFPRVRLPLAESRARRVRAAVKEQADLKWWRDLFKRVNDSTFLKGKNDRRWRADFDFAIQKKDKILEGSYDPVPEANAPPPKCALCGGAGCIMNEETGVWDECKCQQKAEVAN